MAKHPIQPLELDAHGVIRFKANAIVRYLLDNGGIDMNRLATVSFPDEDREQFMQLIGYSHSGVYGVSEEVWQSAQTMYESGVSETEARSQFLRHELNHLRDAIREPIARLFSIHPDDLKKE
jgi:hypothetical protein